MVEGTQRPPFLLLYSAYTHCRASIQLVEKPNSPSQQKGEKETEERIRPLKSIPKLNMSHLPTAH